MSRIKRMACALMVSGALLNLAPVASAAEPEPAAHCLPFVDHPVICFVTCTVQNLSVKPCAEIECNDQDFPTVCYVVNQVWQVLP